MHRAKHSTTVSVSCGRFARRTRTSAARAGSVSKTLGPALRLAWMVLPPHLVEPVVRAKHEADLYSETLGQLVLADLIGTSAYCRHIRAVRQRYRRRRELLTRRVAAIPGLTVHGVPAGLHTLLAGGADWPGEQEILAACARDGIAVRGLASLYAEPPERGGVAAPPGLVVGFGAPAEHAFPAALDALTAVLRETAARSAVRARRP